MRAFAWRRRPLAGREVWGFPVLLAGFLAAPLVGQEPRPWTGEALAGRLRLGFESVDVRPGENLGLLGVHAEIFPGAGAREARQGLYLGLGGFAAVRGERGGFFVGGLDAGGILPLGPSFALEAGLFAGGGGGGAAPQGSGLMLRAHAAAEWRPGSTGLRLEWSRTEFPDGAIGGSSLGLGASLPWGPSVLRRGVPRPGAPAPASPWRLQAELLLHRNDDGARDTRGRPLATTLGAPGIRLDHFLGGAWFLTGSAHGALAGSADGFAEFLLGPGLETCLAGPLRAEARLLAGAAGGGEVDTGGGFLLRPAAGLRLDLSAGTSLALGLSRSEAPGGSWSAWTLEAGLAAEVQGLDFSAAPGAILPEGVEALPIDLALADKAAFPGSGARRRDGRPLESPLQMLGLRLRHPLGGGPFALRGEAWGAFDGGIGGYAEGWFGADLALPAPRSLDLRLDLGLGAGGGGGVDVGDGLLLGGGLEAGVALAEDLRLGLRLGREEAPDGLYEATVLALALELRFHVPRAPRRSAGEGLP